MLGKNNQYKFQKLSQNQKVKKKMKKKGKQWLTATITTTALGIGFFSIDSMITHADTTTQTTVQQENNGNTQNTQPVSPDEQNYEQSQTSVQNDASTKQGHAKTTNLDVSQHDQDKGQPKVDAKNDNNTNQQNAPKVTPSNVINDQQQANQQPANVNNKQDHADNGHDQNNTSDNIDPNKQAQPSNEKDDNKQDNTGQADQQDKVTVSPQSTPVAKKWDDKKIDVKANANSTTGKDNTKQDDKVAPKFDTMKINGVDKVNVAVQNPQGQVITHLPLNQDQLPQDYDGKTPLTFAQVKAATGTVKSTTGQRDSVIPAPDKDGNYNWNADQFAAAKAQNAVHAGVWGTAQWFIDKNNNLFVSNGELSNDQYKNQGNATYTNQNNDEIEDLGTFTSPSSLYFYNSNNISLDQITNGNIKSFSYAGQDPTGSVDDYIQKSTSMNSWMKQYPSFDFNLHLYRKFNRNIGHRNDEYAQGLSAAIFKTLGQQNISLNSVNFTSGVKLPENSSNLFKSSIISNLSSSNKYDNGSGQYILYCQLNPKHWSSDVEKVTEFKYSNGSYQIPDSTSYRVNSSYNNMIINKITGYNNMSTSQTTNMSNMFGGQAVDPDISSWDTSNTTDMSNMMSGTQESHLDLSHNDLSKVTDFSNMANTPTLRTANLNNDTIQNSSNKTNMLNSNVQEVSFNNKGTS